MVGKFRVGQKCHRKCRARKITFAVQSEKPRYHGLFRKRYRSAGKPESTFLRRGNHAFERRSSGGKAFSFVKLWRKFFWRENRECKGLEREFREERFLREGGKCA
jgi:hypothetical protein